VFAFNVWPATSVLLPLLLVWCVCYKRVCMVVFWAEGAVLGWLVGLSSLVLDILVYCVRFYGILYGRYFYFYCYSSWLYVFYVLHSLHNKTSTIVFYRTRVYQMQPQNGQNWHSSVGKYVHHNRETARIAFCTSLKSISISGFVDTRDKVNADYFLNLFEFLSRFRGKSCMTSAIGQLPKSEFAHL